MVVKWIHIYVTFPHVLAHYESISAGVQADFFSAGDDSAKSGN